MLNDLQQIKITLPKADSYLMYFLLESHEGIAFYSTINEPNNPKGFVTIECNFHVTTAPLVHHLLSQIQKQNLMQLNLLNQ